MKDYTVKTYKKKINFDICGICVNEIKKLLQLANAKKTVIVKLTTADNETHIEVKEK